MYHVKIYDSKRYLEEQIKTKNYLQIAKENGIGKSTMQRKLKKFGLTKSTIPWSEQEIQKLTENYETRGNIHSLFPNRTKTSVYHLAHKLSLKRHLRKRYNSVDEHFFKRWNNESSYVLGWMFSDGNVSKDGRTFGFHLSKKDVSVLRKIKKAMKSKHRIFTRGEHVEFRVHSIKMCNDLISLGCMPKKTLKIKFPNNIPARCISHFVRGYFEGDGSIFFNHPNTIKIKIVGNRKFIKDLKGRIAGTADIKASKMKYVGSNTWQMEIYGGNARKFCNWIYNDCGTLYLNRKRERFQKHMEKRESYTE